MVRFARIRRGGRAGSDGWTDRGAPGVSRSRFSWFRRVQKKIDWTFYVRLAVSGDEPTGRTPSGDLGERIRALGYALGFDRVGICSAEPGPDTEFVRDWIASGHGGEMGYLARRLDERVDPRRLLPGAQSIVSVGLFYGDAAGETPPSQQPAGIQSEASVSCYAGGDDYHDVLGDRLRSLEAALPSLAGAPVRSRAYVDTGPVLERVHAARAGLGWIGKNTCLIDPTLGSYLFLGALLTDLALLPDRPEPDHCGTCRACLDACPTDAFPEPYVLDARRCLSYTTIELRGPVPEDLREATADRLHGCDVCQEVCPWNTRERRRTPGDPLGLRTRMAQRDPWRRPDLAWLLALDEEGWRRTTRRTALRRPGLRGMLRNALVAAGNSGDLSLVPAIRRHSEGGDSMLAEHARWALARLDSASRA